MSQSTSSAVAAAARMQDAHRRQVELVKASIVCCPTKSVGTGRQS